MNPLVSTIISGFFLLFGAVAVYTMMRRMGGKELLKPEVYTTVHKIAGWAFVLLFIIMFIFMLERVENYWEESSPRITLHISLALALLLLLVIKVTIPRFFARLGKNLFLLGTGVYLVAFSLVTITGGYYIIRTVERTPYLTHADLPKHILDINVGKELFINKCSTCHMLDKIMKPRSAEAWETVVNEMVSLAEPRIRVNEGIQILHYLTLTHVPKSPKIPEDASLVEKHCLSCHEANEIYVRRYSEPGWREIVKKMNECDPGIIPLDKIDEMVEFLLRNQK
jgi:hypothetical protein